MLKDWPDRGRIPTAVFEKWADLAVVERETDFRDRIYDIEESHLVGLDDVGREADKFKSGAPQVRLAEVLDVCKNKWLVLTTNVVRRDWSNAFDGRVISRLSSAAYVGLDGVPDYRPSLNSV